KQSPLAQAYNVHRWPKIGVFSPDGSRFFLGQGSFTFGSVHDTATGKRLVGLSDGTYRFALGAAFSPDGREVAVVTTDGLDGRCQLLVAEVSTGSERFRFHGLEYPGPERPALLSYSPDGRHLLAASGRIARLWQTETM